MIILIIITINIDFKNYSSFNSYIFFNYYINYNNYKC